MRNALNSLLDLFTQEAQLHLSFANELRGKVLNPIQNARVKLSEDKLAWLAALDKLKANIVAVQDRLKSEQSRFHSVNTELESMSAKLQKSANTTLAEQRQFQELIQTRQSMEAPLAAFRATVVRAESQHVQDVRKILDSVQDKEAARISLIKLALTQTCESAENMATQSLGCYESVHKVCTQVNESADIESYIAKTGAANTDRDSLLDLYKAMGECTPAEGEKSPAVFSAAKDVPEEKKLDIAAGVGEGRKTTAQIKEKLIASKLAQLREKVHLIDEVFSLYPFVTVLKSLDFHKDLKGDSLDPLRPFIGIVHLTFGRYFYQHAAEKLPTWLAKAAGIPPDEDESLRKLVLSVALSKSLKFSPGQFVYYVLLFLIKHWKDILTKTSAVALAVSEESACKCYKAVYTMAWSLLFWQVLQRAHYRDSEFEKELATVCKVSQLAEFMRSPNVVKNVEFAEFTMHSLYVLKKSGHFSLKLPPVLSYKLFCRFVAPGLISEEEKNLLPPELETRVAETKGLCAALDITEVRVYTYTLGYVFDRYLASSRTKMNFSVPDETQNKATRCMVALAKKLGAISAGAEKSANGASPVSYEALTGRAERAGVLMRMNDSLEESLSDIAGNFGKCVNKLKAVLMVWQQIYKAWYHPL